MRPAATSQKFEQIVCDQINAELAEACGHILDKVKCLRFCARKALGGEK
jgi:hypothetical protein